VQGLIDAEVASGVDPRRIVLGGFSQGAALSLFTAYQSPVRIGGVVALSGYIPFKGDFAPVITAEAKARPDAGALPPALVCHGDSDGVVAFKAGQKARDTLKSAGVPVEWHQYSDMEHATCDEEMQHVAQFLAKCLPDVPPPPAAGTAADTAAKDKDKAPAAAAAASAPSAAAAAAAPPK
jgi:predicted esterase